MMVSNLLGETENQTSYPLPDGSELILKDERFKCCEIAFDSKLYGFKSPEIHKLLLETIGIGDVDLRSQLYANVYLSGGMTNIENFGRRLHQELIAHGPRMA